MNYLRDFLRSHRDWEEILTDSPYNLKVSRDDGYILFKYNQVESDFSIPLVREARGIIFRDDGFFDCVCRPFDKFGNYGESYVPDIDWYTASVQTKIDGSLIKLWYDNGAWHVSTNGTIDAYKAELNDAKYKSFGELFNSAFNWRIVELINKAYTYMFELVSPHNKVVIPYPETKLYFLGFRDNYSSEEFSPANSVVSMWYDIPERHALAVTNLNNVISLAEKLPWSEEGYVVCDGNFNRIKVKSPAYVAAHYLVTGRVNSTSRLIDIILEGEIEEFLTYAPEYAENILALKGKMATFSIKALSRATYFKTLPTVKGVALTMKENHIPSPYQSFIFENYRKGTSIQDWTRNWDGDKWEKNLKGVGLL